MTVSGSNNVNMEVIAKMPYAEFPNPKNPSLSVCDNYEATHGASPYNSSVAKAVNDLQKQVMQKSGRTLVSCTTRHKLVRWPTRT